MGLHEQVRKIVREHPALRRHLVPILRRYASGCDFVTGSNRTQYTDAVWDMYVKTYKAIGLIVSNANGLIQEFPQWELCLGQDGGPHAFGLFKPTSFGLKAGLSGHDGTSEGRSFALANL